VSRGAGERMHALICGAGVAGLALAGPLGRLGWEVTVVERSSALRDGGYMIDFFGPGHDAAEAMGLLPSLRERAYAVSGVSYVDRRGKTVAGLDYRRAARALDGRLLDLMRGDLVQILYEALGDGVQVRFGSSVQSIEETAGGVTVTLSDGGRAGADLLVGADGIHSTTRALAFGPESAFLRHLGLHTAAYTFEHPELHERLAGRFTFTDSAERAVGLYGIRGGRVAAFTVHRTSDPGLPDDPRSVVQETYADLGWVVPEVLSLCPPPPALYYDQVAQIEMPSWSSGRVALAGDACQAVSLLAGQGASLAVAGAHVMAEEVSRNDTVDAALARYHERMAPVVAAKQAAGRRTADWFLPGSPARLLMRRVALWGMRLPGLDRLLGSGLVAGVGRIP
jgi:2-polyprenyl-6-methoxyphenol hydroxylase-like FAD-dependent oxidoreductase